MNTELGEGRGGGGAKNHIAKDFVKLMINPVFRKFMENVRKNWDIKLVTTERGRNYLVSEQN